MQSDEVIRLIVKKLEKEKFMKLEKSIDEKMADIKN